MRATSINHVSVHALDLDESIAFYEGLFGMQRIATPNFAFPVQWLRLGDQQFHLFVRENQPGPQYHHLGINVDDFDAFWRRAGDHELFDTTAFFSKVYELPDGSVQLYIRDPADNLIEIDWPDVKTIGADIRAELVKLGDTVAQTGEALDATLYLARRDGGPAQRLPLPSAGR
jgi:lactoylglutathione lyase